MLKAEVMASIALLATMLPIPYKILISMKKAMFYFLWGGQHKRAKREIMYKPVGKGGRAVPEVESKCNAMFITPIFKACFSDPKDKLWPYFTRFWVGWRVLQAPLTCPSLNNIL